MLVAVIALYVYVGTVGGDRHHGTFMFYTLAARRPVVDGAEVAVPRLLHRVRDQGAAVAVPHLAAGRRGVRPARRRGPDARRDRQGRHVRHDPVLPRAVPGRVPLLRAAGPRPGGDLASSTGPRGDRADLDEAAGRRTPRSRTSASSCSASSRSPPRAQSGATLYMVNHGFSTGALFLVAGFLIVRRGSDWIADYGGVQKVAPVLAGLFLVAGLAGLALPGLSTFVSRVPRARRHVLPVQGRGLVRGGRASSWPRSTCCGCTSAR